jgi:hypothetical protein
LTKAKEGNSEIYFASDLITEDYPSDLIGDYQMHNKKTVIQPYRFWNKQTEFRNYLKICRLVCYMVKKHRTSRQVAANINGSKSNLRYCS